MPNTPKGITYPSNSSPVAVPADLQELATDVDGLIVPNTGGTYTGSVSFTQSPSVPTPTSSLHVVNKTYADAIDAKFANVGNLLTANQASVETDTTGFDCDGGTISRDGYALHGSASLRFESTGTGAINAGIPAGASTAVPVTAGQTYTYTFAVRPINTQSLNLYVVYRGADGTTWVDESMGPTTVCADSTWTTLTYTHTAPAGAYYAHHWCYAPSSTVGQRFNLDCLGVWRGASGQWAMPGTPILGLTDGLAGIGNLLTANQASGGDALGTAAGFDGWQATVTRSTTQALSGSGSILATMTAAVATAYTLPSTALEATDVGNTITCVVYVRAAVNTPTCYLRLNWFNAGGTKIGTAVSSTVVTSTSWQRLEVSAVAPAGVASVMPEPILTGAANDAVFLDQWGVWRGAGGRWALPGVPVVGQSHIAANGAYTSSGTVAPEGAITAPPLSRYQQVSGAPTASGAMEWIKATGTGNTGWVAGPEADTGWRELTPLSPSNTTVGWLRIRRVGQVVQVSYRITITDTAWKAVSGVLAGFKPRGAYIGGVCPRPGGGGPLDGTQWMMDADVNLSIRADNASIMDGGFSYLAYDAWPTSLPGTAA